MPGGILFCKVIGWLTSTGESVLKRQGMKTWLERSSPVVFTSWAIVAAFGTYFCMYAFRKPFAVGTYEGAMTFGEWDLTYKALFIISQVFGYCTSKFLGIKFVSEMPRAKRAFAIVLLVGLAELALVAFALVPAPYNAICLFFNGLPLGMIWGLF